jgi:uncharacterized protein (TIGR03086 family)
MTDPTSPPTAAELPFFPVPAPAVFSSGPEPVLALMLPVFDDLATVIAAVRAEDLGRRTPCTDFDLAVLRDHVLGWLQFFAAALADPQRRTRRPDPVAYRAADDPRDHGELVRECARTVAAAVRSGVQDGDVAVSQARMSGPSVLGMMLGEYLVHGWDLARALERPWDPPRAAVTAGLDFFAGMVSPQYRGGDAGFFAEEVPVPADAPALDRLLGFAGRDPRWTASPTA